MYHHKDGVHLRKIERLDLEALLSLKQESWTSVHHAPILNSEDQQTWFNNLKDLVMIYEWEQQPIGVALLRDFDWIARSVSVSSSIYQPYREKALVKKSAAAFIDFSFEMFNLHRLSAEVVEYNYPAQHYEIDYLGFQVEGIRRQSVYKAGKYYNSLLLGLLRSDWEQQSRVLAYQGSCSTQFNHQLAERLIQRSRHYLQPQTVADTQSPHSLASKVD